MLLAAKRPVIYAGGGVISANAEAQLLALAEKLQCPVTTTLMGHGAFPPEHSLALHTLACMVVSMPMLPLTKRI